MKRHSRASGKSVKGDRHKGATPKRSIPPDAVSGPRSAATDEQTQIARLTRELAEARKQLTDALGEQAATSDVLRVISSSPGELQPVFEAMLESALRICEANFGGMFRLENGAVRMVTRLRVPERLSEFLQKNRDSFGPLHPWSRLIQSQQTLHIADYSNDPAYLERDPVAIAGVELGGIRTLLAVPMLKDDELVGFVTIFRQDVRPFTDKQIELVTNFATQAVIAIENARLLNELRESLEQQTATSEVLKVISSSAGELKPVFEAMLENAVRICDAKFGNLWLREGDNKVRIVAIKGASKEYRDYLFSEPVVELDPQTAIARIVRSKEVVQIDDISSAPTYGQRMRIATIQIAKARTLVGVPMLKDDQVIGIIVIYHQEVRSFTDKQIELLKSFGAQAVIAIENTRLLNELRESLEQQTATSDVLRVISSSPGELKPVFQAMLENATSLCEAKFGVLFRAEGDALRAVALYGAPLPYVEERQRNPVVRPSPQTTLGRAVISKQTVHTTDVLEEPNYFDAVSGHTSPQLTRLAGARTVLAVPMIKDGELIGAFVIYRQEVRPFTDKQIALVQNFAAQAVIAIENARLLNELRQRTDDLTETLEQQTGTSEILRAISSSPTNVQPVLDTIVRTAVSLCNSYDAVILLREGEYLCIASHHGPMALDFERLPLGRDFVSGRSVIDGVPVHVPDFMAAGAEFPRGREVAKRLKQRTVLSLPLKREGQTIGCLFLRRTEVLPFTKKQIELLTTFADQAVIAIENVRLFEAEQQRTRQLTRSLEDLRTAQDRLVQTQKLASLGQLTAGIAHEIKNPLNFVNNFSGLSVELIDELQESLAGASLDDKRRSEVAEITETLRQNLDKISQHGKRADSIVKNMLLHSREGSGEQRAVDINSIVEESLNLAYHGARAEKQGFNITLERSFDPEAGQAELYPQEISRALLNFIANGFYAATKRSAQADNNGYEPMLTASTKNLGDRVEIRIRDNGTGIPPEVKEKIFNPFFTTKPAGEGTGLGLSLSHDIIVKQHAGSIEVDSAPGEFTEIRIVLPRTAIVSVKPGG